MEPKSRRLLGGAGGFTLLELMLATFLSTMVVGMVAASLSFCLRLWERHRSCEPNDVQYILDLMTLQLGSYDPTPVTFSEGEQMIFFGDRYSITFATDYSVKALCGGAPVLAHYVFYPEDGRVYYAETPFNSSDSDAVKDFVDLKPGAKNSSVPFYSVAASDFSIRFIQRRETDEAAQAESEYAGKLGKSGKDGAWEGDPKTLEGVLVYIVSGNGTHSMTKFIVPAFMNFLQLGDPDKDSVASGSGSSGNSNGK
jgi:hypothetical protein